MTRRPRAAAAGLGLALGAIAAAGCSDDDATARPPLGTTSTTVDAFAADLPPAAALDLEPLYGEALARLGLRLTDRGGLIDRSDGGYVPSPDGTHLALYVEPVADYDEEQYIEGIREVTLVFADVFDRWPQLESFDVCQEPVEDTRSGREPYAVTQIELTRAQAAALDLDSATVIDLVRASLQDPPELSLRVAPRVRRGAAYEAILAAAAS